MRFNRAAVFIFAGLIASLGGGAAFGQTFVKPGDTGAIEIPLENDAALSAGTIENVSVSVAVPAAFTSHFTVTGVSVKEDSTQPPTTFNLGDAKTLVIQYAIGPDAPDGSFDATVTVITPDQAVIFDPPTADFVTKLGSLAVAAVVGESRKIVCKEAPFNPLKLWTLSEAPGEIPDARARRTAWPSIEAAHARPASDAGRPSEPRLRFSLSTKWIKRPFRSAKCFVVWKK